MILRSASSTNATCTAVAFVRYVNLTAVKHDLKFVNKPQICHVATNTTLILNAGVNLGKSYLEACKLATTPSGQLIRRSLISDTLWQINLRWRCKESAEMNKHVIIAFRLCRQFVTSNAPHLDTNNRE